MCKKKQFKYCPSEIDRCLNNLLIELSFAKLNIISACCGHFKYHMTIVVKKKIDNECFELLSQVDIPRKKRFYLRDRQGYYFIPEVEEYWKNK